MSLISPSRELGKEKSRKTCNKKILCNVDVSQHLKNKIEKWKSYLIRTKAGILRPDPLRQETLKVFDMNDFGDASVIASYVYQSIVT